MIVLNQNNWYAVANITGDISCPNLKGIAYFKPFKDGVMVEIEVSGLPVRNNYELFLVDIHEGKDCVISNEGTFMNIGKDYNPNDLYHPYMVGDMPYLFSNNDFNAKRIEKYFSLSFEKILSSITTLTQLLIKFLNSAQFCGFVKLIP